MKKKYFFRKYQEELTWEEYLLLEREERKDRLDSEATCSYALEGWERLAFPYYQMDEFQNYGIREVKINSSSDYRTQKWLCRMDSDALRWLEEHKNLWDNDENKDEEIIVGWMKVNGMYVWPRMGSLRDGKLVRWANKIIDAIKMGDGVDGRWLYEHTKDIQNRAPYGLKGRTRELISQIWFFWKYRKACIAIVNAFRRKEVKK